MAHLWRSCNEDRIPSDTREFFRCLGVTQLLQKVGWRASGHYRFSWMDKEPQPSVASSAALFFTLAPRKTGAALNLGGARPRSSPSVPKPIMEVGADIPTMIRWVPGRDGFPGGFREVKKSE